MTTHVLMLSTAPEVPGGMTTMAQMTMAHATRTAFTFLPVGRVGQEHIWARVWRLIAVPIAVARAAKTVDVVHLNTPFNAKGLLRDGLILLALRLTGYRAVLLYIHGWQPRVAAHIQASPWLRKPFLWLLRDVPQIMVLSQSFKEALVSIGVSPERITVTRTMFDGRYIQPSYNNGDRRRILFLSRFVREKGVYELLEAFTRIATEYPDVDLVLAGDGPENAALRALAARQPYAHRIHFPGYVEGVEKAALLTACSIFALPTYYPEGLPVALLEAMAAGKPLLTAKAGGIAEIISQPENGIVLDRVTVDTVADALRYVLAHPEVCRTTGANNAAYAWARFEAGAVTKEIEAAYQTILSCTS